MRQQVTAFIRYANICAPNNQNYTWHGAQCNWHRVKYRRHQPPTCDPAHVGVSLIAVVVSPAPCLDRLVALCLAKVGQRAHLWWADDVVWLSEVGAIGQPAGSSRGMSSVWLVWLPPCRESAWPSCWCRNGWFPEDTELRYTAGDCTGPAALAAAWSTQDRTTGCSSLVLRCPQACAKCRRMHVKDYRALPPAPSIQPVMRLHLQRELQPTPACPSSDSL